MSMGIHIDWDDVPDRIREMAEKLDDPEPVLEDWGGHLVHRWTNSFAQTGTGESSEPGQPPAIQSGQLKNSLTWETRDDALEAGTNVIYGRIQHMGGTIEPDEAQALTIPLTKKAQKTSKRAGDFSGLFFVPGGEKDNVIGVLAKESGSGIKPIFALAEEVELPARPWLTVEDEDWDFLEEIMTEELEDA